MSAEIASMRTQSISRIKMQLLMQEFTKKRPLISGKCAEKDTVESCWYGNRQSQQNVSVYGLSVLVENKTFLHQSGDFFLVKTYLHDRRITSTKILPWLRVNIQWKYVDRCLMSFRLKYNGYFQYKSCNITKAIKLRGAQNKYQIQNITAKKLSL